MRLLHTRVAVIGGGTAGSSVANQLVNSKQFDGKDITVFEPQKTHHYQPGYTMVAGGVLGTTEETKKKQSKYVTKPMNFMFQNGINL